MSNENAIGVFKIENCRAKIRVAGDLVDCLSPQQANLCGFSLSFGEGYFCKHHYRQAIIDNTEKLEGHPTSQSDIQID